MRRSRRRGAITLGGGAFQPDSGDTLTLSGVAERQRRADAERRGDAGPVRRQQQLHGRRHDHGRDLSVGADADLGAGANTVTLNGGALETTATFASARNMTLGGGAFSPTAATTLTLSGVLSGGGGLDAERGGDAAALRRQHVTRAASRSRPATSSVSADGDLGDAANTVTLNGGALVTTAAFTSARNMTLGGGAFTTNAVGFTVSGVLSGAGGLTENGTGALILTGTNTFTGGVTISSGEVEISADNNLGNAANNITLSGNGRVRAVATFASARTITLGAGGGNLTSFGGGQVLTLSGVISGSGALTALIGAGTLVLTGTNTYTGGTTVEFRTTPVSADANLGAASGGLTLNAGNLITTATFTSARAVTLGGAHVRAQRGDDADAVGPAEQHRRADVERGRDAAPLRRQQQLHGRQHDHRRQPERGRGRRPRAPPRTR